MHLMEFPVIQFLHCETVLHHHFGIQLLIRDSDGTRAPVFVIRDGVLESVVDLAAEGSANFREREIVGVVSE